MLNRIKALSNNSKYTKWYCNIISSAISRDIVVSGENHHIVPISLYNEGRKYSSNIVKLTHREHYVCHKLLVKMLIDSNHIAKMSFALWRLSHKRISDGIILKSTDYAIARVLHSEAMSLAWASGKFDKVVENKRWFYDSEEQKEANRQKALLEMQNPERKEAFIKAGSTAAKSIRDADPKAWVKQSMGSVEGMAKAKAKSQTKENRKACSERELAKSKEERSALAKQGQQALMEKLGGGEEYRKYLSERIKGRKKYINPETGQVRMLKEPIEGFIIAKEGLAQKD